MRRPVRRVDATASRLLAVKRAAVRAGTSAGAAQGFTALVPPRSDVRRCQNDDFCAMVAISYRSGAAKHSRTGASVCRYARIQEQKNCPEVRSRCCGGRTDPSTREATAAAARFGRLESCSAALLGPPYVLFSRPQALASPPITCTHCSRKRWPGLAAEASITITRGTLGPGFPAPAPRHAYFSRGFFVERCFGSGGTPRREMGARGRRFQFFFFT